jgi:hypothetical protein
MTLAEFRKKHPKCKVGYPSPTFPLVMLLLCAGFMVMLLRFLVHVIVDFRSIEDPQEVIAGFGAICLSLGVGAGVYVLGQRLGEVLNWARTGRCMFAVAEDEVLIVGEQGDSVVFPIAGVTKLDLHNHYLTIKMVKNYANEDVLSITLSRVFSVGGDGPSAYTFFNTLAPLVKKLAPKAEVTRKDPTLFGP